MQSERRTMAFSNAALVIISLGKILFSRRLSIALPAESHSASFSGYSAGKEDEPGRVIPRASAALAIVFAVYICDLINVVPYKFGPWYSLHHKHQAQDMHGG